MRGKHLCTVVSLVLAKCKRPAPLCTGTSAYRRRFDASRETDDDRGRKHVVRGRILTSHAQREQKKCEVQGDMNSMMP
jgi:hypothetical protein